MEVTDLMVGDLVIKHTATRGDMVCTVTPCIINSYEFDWSQIPTTAEILAKNFKLSGYDRYYVGKDLYVKWYDNDTFGFGKMNDAYNEPQFESFAKVNSVHELQHALRVVGLKDVANKLIVE